MDTLPPLNLWWRFRFCFHFRSYYFFSHLLSPSQFYLVGVAVVFPLGQITQAGYPFSFYLTDYFVIKWSHLLFPLPFASLSLPNLSIYLSIYVFVCIYPTHQYGHDVTSSILKAELNRFELSFPSRKRVAILGLKCPVSPTFTPRMEGE